MFSFLTRKYSLADLGYTTDIHSHILPGVDDGIKDVQTASEVLSMMYSMGVKRFVFTPHIYPELYPANSSGPLKAKFESVSSVASGIGADCFLAGEHMIYQGIDFTDAEVLPLPGNLVLIEMSYAFSSPNLRYAIFQLRSLGYIPVLAHPERYAYFSRSLSEVKALSQLDCRFQLNLLSLGGFYGKAAQEKAQKILSEGYYSYAGSDLHALSQVSQLKSLQIEKKYALQLKRIFEENTRLYLNLSSL